MSNVGKWDRWYSLYTGEQPYGDKATYELGGRFLRDCAVTEDWGCGSGWFRRYIPNGRYRGIDGSHTPCAESIVDLVDYRSQVPGIFMRHVLEHNYQWQFILSNALDSFTERMVLIIFTPMAEKTKEIAYSEDPGVPDISFSLDELLGIFTKHNVEAKWDTFETDTQYKIETVFYLEKP